MRAERRGVEGLSERLAEVLASGDMERIRSVLLTLTETERAQLAQHIGAAAVEALTRNVRRARSSDKRGRVVVVNGIMGAKLDVVDDGGDRDSVWINYWRLLNGRIEDLELDLQGRPKKRGITVRVAGLFPEYLPLVAELDRCWHVLPFPFDWRLDVDLCARRLAEEIQRWAHGEPVHIVAHSMGGLVSRRFCAMFPEVWASMRDREQRGRGGRLVMLGTPNQGSFAIPMVFSGAEPVVRKLAMLDFEHDLDDLLAILATFPGSYQMLPSPERTFGDDRLKLYERATWGKLAVHAPYLELGRAFQRGMSRVIDAERLVYVAGYGRETPYRIQVKSPGKFRFLTTLNGDGRVPHELGLFDEVRTLWVNETHGDLAKNDAVLEGIHELLSVGTTGSLEHARPAPRRAAPEHKWRESDELVLVDEERERFEEFEELARSAKRGKRAGAQTLTTEQQARLTSLLASEFVGSADRSQARAPKKPRQRAAARSKPVRLEVEVVWGDITRVSGDVYAVGHYNNVLPQNAERALDRMVSPPKATDEQMVLREHTRRGLLNGDVGKVSFYPWFKKEPRRFVAVAGMGYPGKFGRSELRRLARNLALAVSTLPGAKTVCTVLIGAGAGNLPIQDAVVNLVWGIADAIADLETATAVRKLRIVELRRAEAERIHEQISTLGKDAALKERLELRIRSRIVADASAQLTDCEVLSHTLAALLRPAARSGSAAQRRAREKALRALTGAAPSQLDEIAERIAPRAKTKTSGELARLLTVQVGSSDAGSSGRERDLSAPTRLSCVDDGGELRVSLLTKTAVIPERVIRVDRALVDELVVRMTDPEHASVPQLGALLGNLILPRDFRGSVRAADALVVEVDRRTARIHWEMLSVAASVEDTGAALALKGPLARQLRTGYSPAPSHEAASGRKLRMLLVGDPGDPREEDDLPGARREALAIHALLKDRVELDVLIGAPSAPRKGDLRGFEPAARLDVLDRLMRGGYDVLHYCGHGDFDPEDPTRAGWVFEGGLLTALELERVELAPRLVVANACLSGLTSDRRARGASRDEAGLLPSLADEFFHRGVRNYVGTAWEISDEGAIQFATRLYDALIPADQGRGAALGEALEAARGPLERARESYDALWAAYQHYGDPSFHLAARR